MRFLLTKTAQKFRGLAQYPSINTLTMEWAQDLLNVIVDKMGRLSKFRLPVKITPAMSAKALLSLSYYTKSAGAVRQLVISTPTTPPSLVYTDVSGWPVVAPHAIDADATYGEPWDGVESNNVLYMSNGQVSKMWAGAPINGVNFPDTGLPQPALPPQIGWKLPLKNVARNAGVVAINLSDVFTNNRRWFGNAVSGPQFILAFKNLAAPPGLGDLCTLVSTSNPGLNGDYLVQYDTGMNQHIIYMYQIHGSAGPDIGVTPDNGYIILQSSSFNGTDNTGTYVGEPIYALQRGTIGVGGPGIARIYLPVGADGAPDMWFYNHQGSFSPQIPEIIVIVGCTWDSSFNGAWNVTGFGQDGTYGWYVQVAMGGPQAIGAPAAGVFGNIEGGLNFTAPAGSYWLHAYSYKCSVTGEEGPVSDFLATPTSFDGVMHNSRRYMFAPSYPPVPKVDTIVWYRTILGGGTPFLRVELPLQPQAGLGGLTWIPPGQGVGQYLNDGGADEILNQLEVAPILNFPPPPGQNLSVSQGRVFVSGMPGAPNDVAYSAYETVLRGRPETCFYPNNRIRLATGADAVAGHGVSPTGIVIWTISEQMFVLRGAVSDITITTPIAFTEQLEELPYKEGLLNHHTVQNTEQGLVYVDRAMKVRRYNFAGPPMTLSTFITPFMLNINSACYSYIRSARLLWQERDWYTLSVASKDYVPGAGPRFNWMVFFDIDPDEATNAGIWLANVMHDSVATFTDGNLQQRLVVGGAGGNLYEIITDSNTIGGLTPSSARTQTSDVLAAHFTSGYVGQENPQVYKMFRFGNIVADVIPNQMDPGFKLKAYLVNDRDYPFQSPLVQDLSTEFAQGSSGFSVNYKARRCAIRVDFPLVDEDCNVIEIGMTYRPVSER